MRMMWQILTTMIIGLAIANSALGAENDLKVGSIAPGLDIEKWYNSSEITIKNGQVYLILFFSFDDKRLSKLIPSLQEKHEYFALKGLKVIGITSEEVDYVEGQLSKRRREKLTFPIAVDRRSSTSRAWLDAAGHQAPTFFLVGKRGHIQYIGDTSEDEFDDILKQVMEGRYDAIMNEKAVPMIRAAENARKVRNWRMCHKLYDDVIKVDPFVFALYAMEKYEIMLMDQDDPEEASKYAQTLLTEYADDPAFLADFSKKIATDPDISNAKRDLEFAMQSAELAAKQINPEDPDRYALLALIHYHNGRYQQAIQLQKKAYFSALPEEKEHYQRTLRNYQKAAQRESARVKNPTDPE